MQGEGRSMFRTQIQLTEKQARELRALAAERSVSVAELVRQGMEGFLREARGESRTERQARALAATGKFHSGYSDLAEEHHRYLAEAIENR
jgi:hypothetical protein